MLLRRSSRRQRRGIREAAKTSPTCRTVRCCCVARRQDHQVSIEIEVGYFGGRQQTVVRRTSVCSGREDDGWLGYSFDVARDQGVRSK